jgi:hypothetical protein
MDQRIQTCDICQTQFSNGHLARHKKRKHGNAPLPRPVEQSERISDVLLACGFDSEMLGDWTIEELNKIPNLRHYRPSPRRHHTPWQIIAAKELNILPSLEDLLVDIAYRARRNGAMPAGTEVWQESEQVNFTPNEWVVWTKRILEGEQVLTRVLNMPMGHMLATDRSQEYRRCAAEVAARYITNLEAHGFHQNQPSANVTPRGTRTEVHHDSEHHISTAFGSASVKGRPLKLWLLWPSTELRHLATCYGDTKAALNRMDHGSFLVQMPGESVFVPPNSPHAVFALDTCYLYGHTFSSGTWAYDPSTVLVEIKTGVRDKKATHDRVNQLRLGLRSNDFRQAHIDQFIETWAIEAPVLCSQKNEFENLVASWAEDTRDTESCVWCIAAGRPEHYSVGMDISEHVRAHLKGQTLGTDR